MLYTSAWSIFELTTSVFIATVCIGSCKPKLPYNYGHGGPREECHLSLDIEIETLQSLSISKLFSISDFMRVLNDFPNIDIEKRTISGNFPS